MFGVWESRTSGAADGERARIAEAASVVNRGLTPARDTRVYNEASGQRPAASGQRPAASGQRPAASGQRPAASGQRPAASGQRPAASGQRPAASGLMCVRRLAGAREPAPSTPAGSPRLDPRPGRARARLSLLLPVLALLLGVLGLFAAEPAKAQDAIWSGTLTPADLTNDVLGCNRGRALTTQKCSNTAVLDDDDFTYPDGGTNYLIYNIETVDRATRTELVFGLNANNPSGLTDLELRVDGTSFAFADATIDNSALTATWSNSGLTWTAGTAVQLSLVPVPTSMPTPTSLSATAGGGKVTLSWQVPDHSLVVRNRYQVEYGVSPSGSTTVKDTGRLFGGATPSYAVTGLTPGTAYRFRVRTKKQGSLSRSAWSDWVTATPVAPPGVPTGLTLASGDGRNGGELDVSWTAPSGSLTGYDVHYTSSKTVAADAPGGPGNPPSTAWAGVSRGTEANPPTASQTITGLTNGTPYRVRVRAKDANGESGWVEKTGTPQDVTGPAVFSFYPAGGSVTRDAARNIKVAFLEAIKRTSDGADFTTDAQLKTILTLKAGGSDGSNIAYTATIRSSRTSITLDPTANLPDGDIYVAIGDGYYDANGAQGSAASATFTVDTAVPDAPTGLSVSAGNAQLSLSWSRQTDTSRLTDYGYDVHYTSAPSGTVANDAVVQTVSAAAGWFAVSRTETWPPAVSQTIPGLTNNTAYRVRVRAKNLNGVSAWAFGTGTPRAGPKVSLSVSPGTITEGHKRQAGTSALVTATLNYPWEGDGSLFIPLTASSSAQEVSGATGSWLIVPQKSIRIRRGETTGTVRVQAWPDDDADDATVTVALDAANLPAGVGVGATSSVQVTITDDERTGATLAARPTVTLSVSPNPVAENGGAVLVTALLSSALSSDVTIPVVVTRHTAEHGDVSTHRLNIPIFAGNTNSLGTIDVRTDADTDDETFTVSVLPEGLPVTLATGHPASVLVTIRDTANQGTNMGHTAIPSALIQQIVRWRDDPCCVWNKAHTDRWDRVLLAFGQTVEDRSLTAMSAAEAQTYADRGWARWVKVAAELRAWEAANAPAPVVTAPDPVVTIAAGDAVRGGSVTEGEGAAFTLTASPAPAADLAVDVSVTQRGAVAVASMLGAHTVTIPAGTATAVFGVATEDDRVDEADGAVVAVLAAGSGYRLGAPARAVVTVADNDLALPTILTKRSIAREGTDSAVAFTVRLNRPALHSVTVDYATADGSGAWLGTAPARAGADYTATSGTLTFAIGETSKTVRVPILDDAIDEGMEHFLLRFSNPVAGTLAARHRETQGLIRNSDPLQAMWLARFGRMVASDAVASVTARLETPRDAGSHVTVAGQRMNFGEADGGKALATVLTGFAQTFGAPSAPAPDDDDPFLRRGLTSGWNDPATVTGARRVTARELLLGTSFRAVLGQGAGSQWTSWGQGASVSRFSAAVPGLGLSGESATGSMGMDYERGRLLMGFAMTHSVGEGTASDAGWRYALGSTATMAMPYARLALTDRISAWGLAGTGSGRLSLDLDGAVPQSYRTDLAMTLAATGVRGDLVKPVEPGGFALALKADAFWVRTESDRVAESEFGSLMGARGESSRVRAMLDGSRTFSFASGAALTPKLELGVRHDAGDAETGTGLEVGAGLGYADPSRGLDMVLKVHGLAVHAEEGYDEWGVSGQLRLVPGGAGRGLSMSLTPSYGVDPSGSQRLWALPASSGLATNGEAEPSSRFDAEAGYGMALFGGGFTGTPNVGFGLSEAAREVRMGWRLTSAVRGDPGFEVSLDATRREAANENDAEHGVMLRSLIRW